MVSYENAKVVSIISCVEKISTEVSDISVNMYDNYAEISFNVDILDIYKGGMNVLKFVLNSSDKISLEYLEKDDMDLIRVVIKTDISEDSK